MHTFPPGLAEATDLVDPIKAPTVANGRGQHRFGQRQHADPEPKDSSQLRPRRHLRQLCHQLIDIRGGAAGDEKLQTDGKAVQFSWPIRQGECERSAQWRRQVADDGASGGYIYDLQHSSTKEDFAAHRPASGGGSPRGLYVRLEREAVYPRQARKIAAAHAIQLSHSGIIRVPHGVVTAMGQPSTARASCKRAITAKTIAIMRA